MARHVEAGLASNPTMADELDPDDGIFLPVRDAPAVAAQDGRPTFVLGVPPSLAGSVPGGSGHERMTDFAGQTR